MKKVLVTISILLLIFLIGCNKSEIISRPIPTDVPNENIDVEEGKAEVLQKESIYTKFDEVYELQDKEEVVIRKINEEVFLIGFQEKFEYQMNPIFNIYDLSREKSVTINGLLDYIDEVRIENEAIEFYSKGSNIINGFKRFPNITKVDIETGLIETNTIYYPLGFDFKPYYLGNFMNETKLKSLETVNQKIVFDFAVSENSILAGGDHCPNIEVISEDRNILSVDIENLNLEEEAIKTFSDNSSFKIIDVSYYNDGRNINHSVLNFEIADYTEYTCGFETGDDGIRDLVIGFK